MLSHPLLEHPLTLAREIGDRICTVAERDPHTPGALRWKSRPDQRRQEYATGVYSGASGIVLFLLRLFSHTGEQRYLDTALSGLAWLNARLESKDSTLAGPGLYEGRGALAWVCWEAWHATEKEEHLFRTHAVARSIPSRGHRYTDLMLGTAGAGLLFLHLRRETGEVDYLERAETCAEELLRQAQPKGAGLRWPMMARQAMALQTLTRCYNGLSHGTAGCGLFLAELFRETGDRRWADGALGAVRRLRELAEEEQGHWSWDPFDPPTRKENLTQWCHGAPGIGIFFLRAFDIFGDPECWDAAVQCARATRAAGDLRGNPSQCHGLSGNAELFLELHRFLDDREYLEWAREFAGMALRYRHERPEGVVEWDSHYPGTFTPDYQIGSAGVGHFFLRLHAPMDTPLPFLPDP